MDHDFEYGWLQKLQKKLLKHQSGQILNLLSSTCRSTLVTAYISSPRVQRQKWIAILSLNDFENYKTILDHQFILLGGWFRGADVINAVSGWCRATTAGMMLWRSGGCSTKLVELTTTTMTRLQHRSDRTYWDRIARPILLVKLGSLFHTTHLNMQ